MDPHILEFNSVTKAFPGVLALNQVSFKVRRGTIQGLCGENGAGKSTLMKILAGVYPVDTYTGEVVFNGETLQFSGAAIRQAAAKGIAIVHQELALVPQMTVGENIFLGREPGRHGRINWDKLYADTQSLLERYGLELPYSAAVKDLGVGKRQMVEIAKALAEDAQLLILDEPTSALTDAEVETLIGILERLRQAGKTCIYISHKLEEIFAIADDITVLRDGEIAGSLATEETSTGEIITLMVGRKMTERFPTPTREPGDVLLCVDGLCLPDPDKPGKHLVADVSFELQRGEILGVAGLMGSGRSEMVNALFGTYGAAVKGRLSMDGAPISINAIPDAMAHGMALVPEDRKSLGLVTEQSILSNIALPNLERFAGFASLNKHAELQACEEIAQQLAVKAPTLHALVSSLSGGNQQKVVIAKWLLASPQILILDEPTRGIDVGAKYEIYKLMNQLASEGVAILMVSSELPEILGMSDRILVMQEGRCAGLLHRRAATQEKIMALATGIHVHTVTGERTDGDTNE